MNRFIKSLMVALALTGLFGTAAFASTSTPIVGDAAARISGQSVVIRWKTAALAINGIDTTIVNVGPYLKPIIGASSKPTVYFINGMDLNGTDGDSSNVSIDVGVTAGGPWYKVVDFANLYTCTTAIPYRDHLIAHDTYMLAFPFWRVRTKAKAEAFVNRTSYLIFPSLNAYPLK